MMLCTKLSDQKIADIYVRDYCDNVRIQNMDQCCPYT